MIRRKSKILVGILIILMVLSSAFGSVYATEPTSTSEPSWTDTALGILLYPLRLVAYVAAEAVLFITELAFGDAEGNLTPELILFNKVELVSVDFFDMNASEPFVKSLRENVATWYYVIFTIAIIASLCVLLYIAIRMSTSTIASEKADYKRMLFDWVVGFALIFMLHFIILFVITGNNMIVDILAETITEQTDNGATMANFMESIKEDIWAASVTEGVASLIIYIILVFLTLGFVIMYLKRLIVTAFLIIIAPLITVTYAIDRVKDNKSQALDTWIREFVWTVLIQVFHCLIYVVFVTISYETVSNQNLGSAILSIMCMLFITQAEDIVKKIFGIQADNVGKLGGAMALAAASTMSLARKGGKAAGTAGGAAANKVANTARTKNTPGMGTGTPNEKAASSTNSFSQRIAQVVDSPQVQARREQFANFMNKTGTGRGLKTLGNVAKSYGKYSYKGGMALFGATAAAPHAGGDIAKILAGGVAGVAVGDTIASGARKFGDAATRGVVERGRNRNAQNNLEESYNKYKSETNLSDDKIFNDAKKLIKTEVGSAAWDKLNETQKAFANNLQVMQQRLEKSGETDTSIKNILSKIEMQDKPYMEDEKK